MATSYTACGDTSQLEIALESGGPQAVWLDDDLLGQYLLVDERSLPLDWGFLHTRRGLGIYAVGKTTVAGARRFYTGLAHGMRVYTSFESASALLTRRPRPTPSLDPRAEELLRARQRLAARWGQAQLQP
jgi:hypothetical protein